MASQKIVLGLTGGIATGKSTVLKEFSRLGARVLDADRIARKAVRPGEPAWKKIRRRFGPGVFKKDGTLDRARMAKIVFGRPKERKALEKMIHPEVIRTLKKEIAGVRSGLVVADIPLLFEAGLDPWVDKVLVVSAPLRVQLRRLAERNGLKGQEALNHIRSQWPLSKKKKRADYVIDNADSRKKTLRQVRELARRLAR